MNVAAEFSLKKLHMYRLQLDGVLIVGDASEARDQLEKCKIALDKKTDVDILPLRVSSAKFSDEQKKRLNAMCTFVQSPGRLVATTSMS